jgi:(R,R)-butanediol dehydrogenase/meso-butanediol dehydrogenase/diacetyl reductase
VWVKPKPTIGTRAANDKTFKLPTAGHEAVGTVVEVGSEVKQFKPGDRIVNDPLIYCGYCRQCRSGFTNMCENREIYGKRRGAFAECAVLPERVLAHLPDKLSLEEGAVLENFGIAMHSVDIEQHEPGEWAVVLGAGPIGILAAQILTAWGANVVITDLADARLDFARQHTSAVVVDIKHDEPVKKVLDLTHSKGADFVIEMAANQAALDQAFDMVRIRGTVVTIGSFNGPSANPFFKIAPEVKLQGMMGAPGNRGGACR